MARSYSHSIHSSRLLIILNGSAKSESDPPLARWPNSCTSSPTVPDLLRALVMSLSAAYK